MQDPWYKSTLTSFSFEIPLKLGVPHDVFSTQRIDEGTTLFLNHLPDSAPKTVLDLGCGYGALGLPIAAKFKDAQIEMVDRDLLAVKWSAQNAIQNQLTNVHAYGSLGLRDLKQKHYDWILCNVPARIGTPFIKNFMEAGASLLTPAGELRVVVINDLSPIMKELQQEGDWPLTEIFKGPRHSIFAMRAISKKVEPADPLQLYLRDEVLVGEIQLKRPFDLGGDDQKRLKSSLPILLDTLPRQTLPEGSRILVVRPFYGALPLIARKKYPQAQVVSIDRDLLATTFVHENANILGFAGEKLEIRESAFFAEALRNSEVFDLILGEISPSAGEAVAHEELRALTQCLKTGGQALILCLEKTEKDWVKSFADKEKVQVQRVLTREGFTVVRMTR